MALTQERLKELFDYRDDGNLIWRNSRGRVKLGYVAGGLDTKGYIQTGIDGKAYSNHRLIWLWNFGYLPENDLDHIDRDKQNNRIDNLREVSRSCNKRNTGNPGNNKSGVKGVSWNKHTNKWRAHIVVNQTRVHLGRFNDFTEAVCHRLAAEQAEGWEGCDDSSSAMKYIDAYLNQLCSRL